MHRPSRRSATALFALLLAVAAPTAQSAQAASDTATALPAAAEATLCNDLWDGVFDPPSSEPLAACQWDMALIGADAQTWSHADGTGVRVGVIDSGVDLTHPDIAPNLDLASSCSFIRPDDPAIVAGLSDPSEAASGDCSNKAAIDDKSGHGTHVASEIAAPVNGIGIAGVAPRATIVALKACTSSTYCFGYAVAAALRKAGDLRLDVVNLSLFADPYLYYCGNDAGQRAMAREISDAARYATSRGVLIVAAAGNESADLQHPVSDSISPDGPDDTPIERAVGNQCRVLPAELPGALTVMSTGPVGYPGYTMNIADYSSVGGDVAAPGGDFFSATNTPQDGILGALPPDSEIWAIYDNAGSTIPRYRGVTVTDQGATYGFLQGTSMAAPHATGVAALVIDRHPEWSPGAVKAAVQRTATPMSCPANWQPLGPDDTRLKCYGGSDGRTSFFGHGLVNAREAALL
jgi:subtilisin family serine protease